MVADETPASEPWSSDAFLDGLRRQGDPLADGCLAELAETLKDEDFRDLFKRLRRNDTPIPRDAPEPLARYIKQARTLPCFAGDAVDLARVERGQKVFMTHLFPAAMVLLMKSLPEGYATPNLSLVLSETGNLERRTYRRLLGVLQMLVNVSEVGGFAPGGKGLITLAKVRLLHASVRQLVHQRLSRYEDRYGVPVNLEDMLGTIMGFSYLVVAGLEKLRIALDPEEAEDFYYLWRVAGLMMGIHPAGEPDSDAYMPPDLARAAVFYQSYSRRHYVTAAENPDGTALALADLEMIDQMLPQTWLRRRGWKIVPRIFMEVLMGRQALRRVGIRPVRGFLLLRWLLVQLPALWIRLWHFVDRLDPTGRRHARLSQRFLQGLIVRGRGGEITFALPDTLEEFEAL